MIDRIIVENQQIVGPARSKDLPNLGVVPLLAYVEPDVREVLEAEIFYLDRELAELSQIHDIDMSCLSLVLPHLFYE